MLGLHLGLSQVAPPCLIPMFRGRDEESPDQFWSTCFMFGAVFQYSSLHSVFEVSKDAFDNCDARNSILSGRDGNTTITLSTPGQKYFICGTLLHCLGGMKLQVSVNGEDPVSPAPAPLAPKPSDQVPVSIPHPSSNINKPLPGASSAGFLFSAIDSLGVACFCLLGPIFWMMTIWVL